EDVQAVESHDRLERDVELEQLIPDFGRWQRLALVEVETSLFERRLTRLRGVEHVEAAIVPAPAAPPARERIPSLTNGTPHRAGVWALADPLESIQQCRIADRCVTPGAVAGCHGQRYTSASRRSRMARTSSDRSSWIRSIARSP